uniref:Uncharacterized protein n=1 Tax=Cyanoderma ruficeps TaxID=181631 RepID=A0A8C3RCN2_9PASS
MAAPEEEEAAAAESEGGEGGDEEALRRLEALVTDLYRFRDTLTPRDPADPGRDPADPSDDPLVAEMEKTLKLMEEIQVSPEGRGRALVLRARALGVAPEVGGERAELALGHALKLDPALGVAWRQLGEQRWRRGDLRGARDAFGGALQQVWGPGRGPRGHFGGHWGSWWSILVLGGS